MKNLIFLFALLALLSGCATSKTNNLSTAKTAATWEELFDSNEWQPANNQASSTNFKKAI